MKSTVQSKIDAVIFDLDGTLIDSAPDIHACVNRVLLGHGVEQLSLATVTSFIGNGVPTLIDRVNAHCGVDPKLAPQMLGEFLDYYNADPIALTTIYDGVIDALLALRSRGLKIGLCTNKPFEPANSILAQMGMAHLFDAVIGGDSLSQRKPSPEPLLQTVKQLNAKSPAYVGDSEVDANCAQSAGVPFYLFPKGYLKSSADQVVHNAKFDHFTDLPDLLE